MIHSERDSSKHWFEWLPGWVPVCTAILVGAFWVGQYTQGFNDRLKAVEDAVKQIQVFLYSHSSTEGEDALPAGRISQ